MDMARESVPGDAGRVEDGLHKPEARFVSQRQRHVEIGREPRRSDELVERRIRRVHDVAEVERAALLAIPRFE
jgi:hypothetical protein